MENNKLKVIEKELYSIFNEKGIYPEYINCCDAKVCPDIFIEISYEIEGDWKHDHLYSEEIFENYIKNKNWVIVGTDGYITNDTLSDYYGAIHIFKIGIDKDIALSIKKLFVG